jgi:prolyl-tRNA editing enzyme YbaK/EbsC (Cys-tRNA(Pro) deacylase)
MPAMEPAAQLVADALDALGVDHELLDCDPELADTAAFCAHYGYPYDRSANTIVVLSKRPQGLHSASVVLADSRLDVNRTVCRLMGVKKASFAPPDVTAELTGMVMGGVTPFGLPPDFPVYVDGRVMERDWVILGGGARSMKVKVDPVVFERMDQAHVIEGLANAAQT